MQYPQFSSKHTERVGYHERGRLVLEVWLLVLCAQRTGTLHFQGQCPSLWAFFTLCYWVCILWFDVLAKTLWPDVLAKI